MPSPKFRNKIGKQKYKRKALNCLHKTTQGNDLTDTNLPEIITNAYSVTSQTYNLVNGIN